MMALETPSKAKVIPPRREPSGRLKRPTAEQRAAAERKKFESEMATVLAQPHRRGSRHPWCSSALGRFCLANKLRVELFDAANEYAMLVRRWRAAKGVPSETWLGAGDDGDGPTATAVARWWAQIVSIEHQLASVGDRRLAYLAVRHLALDDADLPETEKASGVAGLMALAIHLGKPVGKHPYA